jgi:hypothetical protein
MLQSNNCGDRMLIVDSTEVPRMLLNEPEHLKRYVDRSGDKVSCILVAYLRVTGHEAMVGRICREPRRV